LTNESELEKKMTEKMVQDSGVDDYIDIIDVIGFIWRAKVFVLIGALIGAATVVGIINTKKPPVFKTLLPATFEVAGGVTADSNIAKFNELIGREEVQKSLELANVGFIAGRVPFKLSNSGNQLTLEFASLTSDPLGERALKAAKSLAEASRAVNKKIDNSAESASPKKSARSDLEIKFARLAEAQAREEAIPRVKLFTLEARLAQKSGMNPAPAAIVNGTALGDDVLRLLAGAEVKLTPDERQEILDEYAKLVGEIESIQSKFEQPTREMAAAMAGLSSSIINLAASDGDKFPVVTIDEAAFKSSVVAGSHEHYESKGLIFIIIGLTGGAILGLAMFGFARFARENAERLRRIFIST
jgi:hypothetical protein